jgi:hypothetical protein
VLARLLVKALLGLADVSERRPRMRGSTRNLAASEVASGNLAVPRSEIELLRSLIVELRGGFQRAVAHLVASDV